ncbi:ATP-binding cassette domain-containing protein (plasmid) [Acinetobacter baumannii]|uniref:ATP-binding cassette domain-containing protein n=1 Tax=Acinetobacter baumannii TaxID=470 RepID=UPI000910B81E|nr:ATP-binding cassette domain-containing protein [Acinetobacter baumannii]OIF58422.1 ABC transporter [Acinetobacter baumannii]
MAVYNIDVRYKTSVERTERVLEIAESFGLGLDAKEFVVFDNTPIEIEQGDIVYITGQSGGGKSTLLRKLAEQMQQSGLKVADLNAIEHDDRPIVDQIGETLKDALDVLTIAGITDAYIWLNKFDALSDGQRYRFKLAKLIESKADVWIADEFLAVLDRTVAKVVAYNIQKIARKLGTTVLVATTHDDMVEDLNPSLFIDKRYREKVVITKAPEGFKQV